MPVATLAPFAPLFVVAALAYAGFGILSVLDTFGKVARSE